MNYMLTVFSAKTLPLVQCMVFAKDCLKGIHLFQSSGQSSALRQNQ